MGERVVRKMREGVKRKGGVTQREASHGQRGRKQGEEEVATEERETRNQIKGM